MRVYSGQIKAGSYVMNMRTGKKERISRLYQMHANKQNPKDVIEAGDICAAVGFKDLRTGDTFCDEKHPILLERLNFPNRLSVLLSNPKHKKISINLNLALSKLAEEDPTFTG